MRHMPYGRQCLSCEDIEAVSRALTDDFITGGNRVIEFERKFAEYVGAEFAVAVSSGTAALHTAYLAAGLSSGDIFITTPLTFAATANAGLYCGAFPLFADVNEEDGNISIESIKKNLRSNVKVIVPVHYAGKACDMEAIKDISCSTGAYVIEDSCHALGAEYKNSKIGSCSHSDMAVFSFHPVKSITTGEGGMITTNNSALYEKMIAIRSHGIITDPVHGWKKDMVTLGFNYRITDFQCALGSSQLNRLNLFLEHRSSAAIYYNYIFNNSNLFTALSGTCQYRHAHHLYPVLIKPQVSREDLLKLLRDDGIYSQIHYSLITSHTYYKNLGYDSSDYPKARNISDRVISIPIYYGISKEEQDFIMYSLEKNVNYLIKQG